METWNLKSAMRNVATAGMLGVAAVGCSETTTKKPAPQSMAAQLQELKEEIDGAAQDVKDGDATLTPVLKDVADPSEHIVDLAKEVGLMIETLMKERQMLFGEPYRGIGAALSGKEGVVFVGNVLPGSPAEAAGLLQGDQITAVDGNPVEGKELVEVIAEIQGDDEKNAATLTVLRPGEEAPREITVKVEVLRMKLSVERVGTQE